MGVDTTGDPARSFYDGHGHPFLSKVSGMARPFRIGAKVVWVVRATRANHPNSETGRAAVNVRLVASVDDVLQRHGTPSQTEPASTPEAIWDQQSSGGPSEKYQCTGSVQTGLGAAV